MWISDFYADCRRIYQSAQGNPVVKLVRLCGVPSVHIMLVQRIGHGVSNLWPPFNWLLRIPYGICQFVIKVVYNTSIPARTEIGPGFIILHPGAIYVHPLAKIGRDVTIANCVGIGAARLSDTRYPIVGDNVMVGIGAKVLGPVRVNHHAVIGANSVVLKDVPAYAVAGGVPAKVLKIDRPKRDKRPSRRRRRPPRSNARIRDDKRSGVIHV